MKLAPKIVELATKEIGVTEVDGTNCGERVNEYKSATNLPPTEAWPWCAAFVCHIVRDAMQKCGGKYTFARPVTAGAWDFIKWSLRQDNSTNTKRFPGSDILPGDIVVFTFSHIGIAVASPDGNTVDTVEGNSNPMGSREGGGVFRLTRKLSQIRARIRFTV